MKTLFILLFCLISLQGSSLQKEYFFTSHNITAKFLLKDSNNITQIFTIDKNKTHYKISSKKLLILLSKKGILVKKPKFSYITFNKKSPINTSSLKNRLKEFYTQNLESIEIHNINIHPRVYIDALPLHFSFHINSKNFKHASSTFYITTQKKKRIFFDYTIDASLHVIKSQHILERKEGLNAFNTKKSRIKFTKIRSKPLVHVRKNAYALKHKIKENEVIYMRDVRAFPIIKKGSRVIMYIKEGTLELQSSATAIQDGVLYDMITIEKNDGSRLKAKVIGINKVQMQ